MQSFESFLSLKLPQWDSTGSDLISVIHASFNFWTRHVGLDRRFQTAVDVEERTVGGECFKFGFRWAGPPSYTKITPSSGSKFVLACARKLSKRAAFIPATASEEDTCESIDERYYHGHSQVSSHLTVCPLSLPRSTVTSGRPNVVAPFVRTNTGALYGMVHKPGCVIGSLVQHIKSGSISREGPCQLYSNQHPVQCPCEFEWHFLTVTRESVSRQLWLMISSSNLSSHHPRARCFHHLVVFPGSCPL